MGVLTGQTGRSQGKLTVINVWAMASEAAYAFRPGIVKVCPTVSLLIVFSQVSSILALSCAYSTFLVAPERPFCFG